MNIFNVIIIIIGMFIAINGLITMFMLPKRIDKLSDPMTIKDCIGIQIGLFIFVIWVTIVTIKLITCFQNTL